MPPAEHGERHDSSAPRLPHEPPDDPDPPPAVLRSGRNPSAPMSASERKFGASVHASTRSRPHRPNTSSSTARHASDAIPRPHRRGHTAATSSSPPIAAGVSPA